MACMRVDIANGDAVAVAVVVDTERVAARSPSSAYAASRAFLQAMIAAEAAPSLVVQESDSVVEETTATVIEIDRTAEAVDAAVAALDAHPNY